MSQLCHVISSLNGDLPSVQLSAISFADLDILVNSLSIETQNLEEEFAIKQEAVREQEIQILHNGKSLKRIHSYMQWITNAMQAVEMEVQENEACLCALEQIVNNLVLTSEQRISRDQLKNYEYVQLLSLIERSHKTITMINNISEEINEFQNWEDLKEDPYKLVLTVLNQQLTALKNEEIQIDQLVNKTNLIENDFNQLKDNILNNYVNQKFGCTRLGPHVWKSEVVRRH